MDVDFGQLAIVQALVDGETVPVLHTGEAVYAIDDDGRQWVRKRDVNIGVEELLAEIISWHVGSGLGAPIPLGAVFQDEEGMSWLSERVPMVSHWDARQAAKVANTDGLASLIVLDAIVFNEDRHQGNLLLQNTGDEGIEVWGIDHGQALVGWATDFSSRVAEAPSPHNLAWGIPVNRIALAASEIAKTVKDWPRNQLCEMVMTSCELVREPEPQLIADALLARCVDAEALVSKYLESIRKRSLS